MTKQQDKRVRCLECGHWMSHRAARFKVNPVHIDGCPIDAKRADLAEESEAREHRRESERRQDAITQKERRAAVRRGDLLA